MGTPVFDSGFCLKYGILQLSLPYILRPFRKKSKLTKVNSLRIFSKKLLADGLVYDITKPKQKPKKRETFWFYLSGSRSDLDRPPVIGPVSSIFKVGMINYRNPFISKRLKEV